MLFKDHLKIVTDAGAVLHLGWDYDMPYFLDPLNGTDVDLQTAQGINQTGTTVERQSISGVSRTLDVTFWGSNKLANANFFTRCLPYFTKGTLYFGLCCRKHPILPATRRTRAAASCFTPRSPTGTT